MQKRFKDKVIIVTRGAKGIGKACALAFAIESGSIPHLQKILKD